MVQKQDRPIKIKPIPKTRLEKLVSFVEHKMSIPIFLSLVLWSGLLIYSIYTGVTWFQNPDEKMFPFTKILENPALAWIWFLMSTIFALLIPYLGYILSRPSWYQWGAIFINVSLAFSLIVPRFNYPNIWRPIVGRNNAPQENLTKSLCVPKLVNSPSPFNYESADKSGKVLWALFMAPLHRWGITMRMDANDNGISIAVASISDYTPPYHLKYSTKNIPQAYTLAKGTVACANGNYSSPIERLSPAKAI